MALDRQACLDAALRVAADRHWEAVRLVDVAADLGVPLAELHPSLGEKEDLVDIFWDRADQHMLETCRSEDFQHRAFPDNFESAVHAWLVWPGRHRRTFREMLVVRAEPGHFHIQFPTLLRVSRTVQWMRELCGRRAVFLQRACEEVALSTVFVSTVVDYLNDEQTDGRASQERLHRHLQWAVGIGRFWPSIRREPFNRIRA